MQETIVVYKSETGFTQAYAQWIGEELACKTLPLSEASGANLASYQIVIFGGGIHAGTINGLKQFRKILPSRTGKKVVFFATGATPMGDPNINKFHESNFSIEERAQYPFFYFESGVNYDKATGIMKMMVKMIAKAMAKQGQSSQRGDTKPQGEYGFDNSKREYIQPLVEHVRSFE